MVVTRGASPSGEANKWARFAHDARPAAKLCAGPAPAPAAAPQAAEPNSTVTTAVQLALLQEVQQLVLLPPGQLEQAPLKLPSVSRACQLHSELRFVLRQV